MKNASNTDKKIEEAKEAADLHQLMTITPSKISKIIKESKKPYNIDISRILARGVKENYNVGKSNSRGLTNNVSKDSVTGIEIYRSHTPGEIIVDEETYNMNKCWAIIKNKQDEEIDISKLSDTFTMQKII